MTVQFAWQEKYAEALLELNGDWLAQRIAAAEAAIYQRLEELRHAPASSGEELGAISDALRGLRALAKSECDGQRSYQAPTLQGEEAS